MRLILRFVSLSSQDRRLGQGLGCDVYLVLGQSFEVYYVQQIIPGVLTIHFLVSTFMSLIQQTSSFSELVEAVILPRSKLLDDARCFRGICYRG
jgi:NAD-dependent SIR2 family protein deacetylase